MSTKPKTSPAAKLASAARAVATENTDLKKKLREAHAELARANRTSAALTKEVRALKAAKKAKGTK